MLCVQVAQGRQAEERRFDIQLQPQAFRAIFHDNPVVERPEDKTINRAASQDWIRLRNQLKESRAWLEVRDPCGGMDTLLALSPQCVPDSHVSRIAAKERYNFRKSSSNAA